MSGTVDRDEQIRTKVHEAASWALSRVAIAERVERMTDNAIARAEARAERIALEVVLRMLGYLVIVAMLAGCPTDSKPAPSCASLGCGSAALCNRHGECSCGGQTCELATPDAGGAP